MSRSHLASGPGCKLVHAGGGQRHRRSLRATAHDSRVSSGHFQWLCHQGSNALQAGKLLNDFVSAPIPSNQWQLETEHWFKTSLAVLQRAVVEYPINSWSKKADLQRALVVSPPPSDYDVFSQDLQVLCSRQRTQSTGAYVNLLLPPVILMVVVCLLIFTISLILPTLVNHLPSRRAMGSARHRFRAYVADSQLSLLRMHLTDMMSMAGEAATSRSLGEMRQMAM